MSATQKGHLDDHEAPSQAYSCYLSRKSFVELGKTGSTHLRSRSVSAGPVSRERKPPEPPCDGTCDEPNISSVAFSHDGKYVASGSGDNSVKVWSVEDRLPAFSNSTNGENDVEWSWNNIVYGKADGWVVGRKEELLLWVPPDMRDSLSCSRRNIAILVRSFTTKVDLCNAAIGPRWRECFNPPVP